MSTASFPAPARAERAAVRIPEDAAALTAAVGAALLAQANLLRGDIVEGDALVHQYWMRSFAHPELFPDPLTAALRGSERYPKGYEALFRAASLVADPIAFGEWLGIALMAVAGWLVFRIVREHTAWRPAAWIGAAVFLALDTHRFSGGFPRGFLQVVVLSTVLMALRERFVLAAAIAASGVLLYPPAALLAVGTLLLASVRLGRRARRAAAAALALAIAAGLVSQLASRTSPDLLTAAQAKPYPEFGANGELHFFVPSALDYLRQNRSGFDLRATGSILALAALGLLIFRPANLRLLRPPVLAMPIASLAGYGLSQALLFRLYLPHRYTYPLVAFFAIVVGVTLRPTWQALLGGRRPWARTLLALAAPLAVWCAALYVFPLGPERAIRPLVAWRTALAIAAALGAAGVAALMLGRLPAAQRAAAGALASGLTILAMVVGAPGHRPPGQPCPQTAASAYLRTLPAATVVAGDPLDLKCVPFTADRGVVISTQLAPSYEARYFHYTRARMFAMLRAYYGPSRSAIVALRRRYRASVIWVRREAVEHERDRLGGVRWHGWQQPYGILVRRLLRRPRRPAVLGLPATCRLWHSGRDAIYDIGCLAP